MTLCAPASVSHLTCSEVAGEFPVYRRAAAFVSRVTRGFGEAAALRSRAAGEHRGGGSNSGRERA